MERRLLILLSCALVGPGRAVAADATLSDVFKRVNPAVLEIHTLGTDVARDGTARQVNVAGLGSGVLISTDGKVLTAAHVVQTADAIEVEFLGGEKIRARVVASEPAADVALLQLEREPREAFVAKIGDSDVVETGDQIFVVGAPLGVSHSLTVGYISGRRKPNSTFGGMSLGEFFQTDAAINPGNSGGPMFNMKGEVIGLVSYNLSQTGGSEGLGFAITSKVASELLITEKSFWSGVNGYLLTGDLALVFNVPPPGLGVLVQRIAAGSPAQQIGLKEGSIRATIGDEELIVGGDIVLAIQGIPLNEAGDLIAAKQKLAGMHPGDLATVTVLRGGRVMSLKAPVPPR
jgi:S1-C subfamily serine protease